MVLLKIGYETIRKSCNPECVIKNRRKGILATQIRYFGRDFCVSGVSRYGNILCTFFFFEGIGAEERKLYWTLKDMMTTNWDSGKMTSLRYVVTQQ